LGDAFESWADKRCCKGDILVIKTDSTIPYSSIFLELDFSYWIAATKAQMRDAMA